MYLRPFSKMVREPFVVANLNRSL